MDIQFKYDLSNINWQELADVYEKAPLGKRDVEQLKRAFEKSYKTCVVYDGDIIVGAGRVISDGEYYSNIYDVVILPEYQNKGIGFDLMVKLKEGLEDLFILLTTTLGKEPFYSKLDFRKHKTAMAIYPASKQKNASMYLED